VYPCCLPSLCTGLWVVLLFISLPKGALILLISLYVEDHLLLAESMMCIDNVLVVELTIMLKMHFHWIGPGSMRCRVLLSRGSEHAFRIRECYCVEK
jgi:hypothetical protein